MTRCLLTVIDDSSPLISYEPVGWWNSYGVASEVNTTEYYKSSYTSTWMHNAFATFEFNGSSISIFGGKRNTYGNFTLTLDGVNTTLSSFSSNNQDPPDLLFSTQMQQGFHKVTISNDGTTGIDIDSISWTSETASGVPSSDKNCSNSTSTPMPSKTYTDNMTEFSWTPNGAWNESSDSANGKSTITVGASMKFTFEGQSISLFGPIGPNFTTSYSVAVDDLSPRYFSARRIDGTAVLYHADHLGPGNHTIAVINHGGGSNSGSGDSFIGTRRQATVSDTQARFGIYHAQVWKEEHIFEVSPPVASQPGQELLSTGAIVGISMGSVVFVALLGLIILLNRRNKALWIRLQNGYTVQSQSDLQPGAPTRSASPPMAQKNTRYHWFSRRQATIEPYPFFSGNHTRFPQTLAMPTHHRNQTGSGSLYQPYAGFGKSKYIPIGGSNDDHTSRGEVQRESDPHGVPLSAPLSNSTHEPTPQRSETILTTVTVSTLVAEDGREPLTDEADMTFVKDPVWEAKRTIRRGAMNVTTPTPSHYRVSDSDLGSHRVPSTKLNSRPRSRSILLPGTRSFRLSQQSSRFPTPHRSRHTRSSSSTEVHLLHRDDDGNPAAGSDLGFDEEDDHDRVFEYDDFEESADFYVQDVRELVELARLRLSTSSVPRSQSDAHTPIRGRSEEFDYSASGLRFSRRLTERENVLGASRLSPIQADFSQHIQLDPNPHRQTSDDTLPPKYTSRAPSLDCPPPFVVA